MNNHYSDTYYDYINVFTDYLDIKYSPNDEEIKSVVKTMFQKQRMTDPRIHHVDAIVMNDTLIVVNGRQSYQFNHLYVLNKDTKTKEFIENVREIQMAG